MAKEQQGKFVGNHAAGYALHHAQVSELPYNFFVVDNSTIPLLRLRFPSNFIVNPEIIKAEDTIEFTDHRTKLTERYNNLIEVKEGCMSFPYREHKLIARMYRITVSYQIPVKKWWSKELKLKTLKQTIEGVQAQIFQHEVDHGLGKNIYFKD